MSPGSVDRFSHRPTKDSGYVLELLTGYHTKIYQSSHIPEVWIGSHTKTHQSGHIPGVWTGSHTKTYHSCPMDKISHKNLPRTVVMSFKCGYVLKQRPTKDNGHVSVVWTGFRTKTPKRQ